MKQRFFILLILCLTISIFATGIPADAQLKASDMSQNNSITNSKKVNADLGRNRSILFEQTLEQTDWSCGVSDANSAGPYYHADNFFGITETITGFSVTGLCLAYPWAANDEDPMTFDVNFYENNAGAIGDLVVTHEVTLERELLGVQFSGFDVLQWTGDFPSGVDMAEGWISVVGTSIGTPEDGLLLWANSPDGDLAEYADSGSGWVASTDPLPDRCFTLYGEDTVLAPIENLAVDESTGLLTWDAPGGGGPTDFYEDFEGTFPPDGWLKLNPDGGTGWEPLELGTTPLPGWVGGEATACPDGGNWQAYCTWTTGGASSNDQWLITPQITVQDGDMLDFWMVYYYDSYFDYVEVLISTTVQNDVSAFDTVVAEIEFVAGSPTDWAQFTYNLTDFVSAGTDVYIAFREVVGDNLNDGSAISIDNVMVGIPTARTAPVVSVQQPVNATRDMNYTHIPNTHLVSSRDLLGYDVYLDTDFYSYTELLEITLEDLVNGDEYTAGVVAVYDEGDAEVVEITFTYTGTEAGNDIVATTKLNGNYPNPFNPVTSIAYSIKDAGNVTIEVYNLKGQLVKTLVNEVKETGDHTAIWNGTDNSNKSVSSGVYFYKMVSVGSISTYTSSKKMILMK